MTGCNKINCVRTHHNFCGKPRNSLLRRGSASDANTNCNKREKIKSSCGTVSPSAIFPQKSVSICDEKNLSSSCGNISVPKFSANVSVNSSVLTLNSSTVAGNYTTVDNTKSPCANNSKQNLSLQQSETKLSPSSKTSDYDSRHTEVAKRRWQLLKKAIQGGRPIVAQFVSTPGARSGLVSYEPVAPQPGSDGVVSYEPVDHLPGDVDQYYRVTCTASQRSVIIRRPLEPARLSPRQLMGFDNTGNICVWSSEEVLLLYCQLALPCWRGKTLLELAGGSTALAGLWVSGSGVCSSVTLTDGHSACVDNIRGCVEANAPLSSPICVRQLQWPVDEAITSTSQQFDVVLAADCVFAGSSHAPLARLLSRMVADGGELVLVAPHRPMGRTDETPSFVQCASSLLQFTALLAAEGFVEQSQDRLDCRLHAAIHKIGSSVSRHQRPNIVVMRRPV